MSAEVSDPEHTQRSSHCSAPPSFFVYPVRSLLTGRIQPALDSSQYGPAIPLPVPQRSNSSSDIGGSIVGRRGGLEGDVPMSKVDTIIGEQGVVEEGDHSTRRCRPSGEQEGSSPSPPSSPPRRQRSQSVPDPGSRLSRRKGKGKTKSRTNYRHFPGDDAGLDKPFSTALSRPPPDSSPSPELVNNQEGDVFWMQSPPLPIVAGPALAATSTSLLPTPPIRSPEIVEEPPTDSISEDILAEPAQDDQSGQEGHLPFNLSEYGLVHLPPLPSSGNSSERWSSDRFYSATSQSGSQSDASNPAKLRRRLQNIHGSHPSSSSLGGAMPGSNDSGSLSNQSSDGPHVTFQFQYVQDADGHHVIVGREGQLQRCEDEPIRTPGAVQGFGVLIAVQDIQEENMLVVRQVSENSTELLGLPPKYLFSLECFTDALPEEQVDIFWDNINFLLEPGGKSLDEEKNSPHVFLLSGWGAPDSAAPGDPNQRDGRMAWSCWCAVHRMEHPDSSNPGLIVIELELEKDRLNPLYPVVETPVIALPRPVVPRRPSAQTTRVSPSCSGEGATSSSDPGTIAPSPPSETSTSVSSDTLFGLDGEDNWLPDKERILESTTTHSKPILALERLRHMSRHTGPEPNPDTPKGQQRRARRQAGRSSAAVGMMDVFAVMTQINDQLGAAMDLENFLKIVVGVIKDLTQFHRVMVYQFDEAWNGQVVAELVDWSKSHDLFMGLHFPAADIPAQARELYAINKVRLLYDRSQRTARIVCKSKEDLETPLNMTHCYLRAMSPIHIQYLENMGVRASMSISILSFGQLWGLVTCHSYGTHGMRVSFPVRQMIRLLSQAISKNIERLSYAQRLHTRKLVNTITSEKHPTGYIVSNADDLLGLFDADFGILVIGEGAKILGPNQNGQEILVMAEYLRLKQFSTIQASQAVINDYPDLRLTTGLEVVAGLLYVPLSRGGRDFIAFLRRGQPRSVKWAGKPYKDQKSGVLEPRKSFKMWSETVAGRCRAWTDEQLETAGVLSLVYGKFIEVWRQKESAMETTKLTNLLLSNASHEVRTPLNHIINYLELALNGSLDGETRENLRRSHAASKGLLFTINDLLDLTRHESGNETSFNEPFHLYRAIEEATALYRREAERRGIEFKLEVRDVPTFVVGDSKKMTTVVQNLVANALKYTEKGGIAVQCSTYGEPEGLRRENQTVIQIVVADTGIGIGGVKLESIFREFEQVESADTTGSDQVGGVGLGLAVVARIVEQLGGQLRVDSIVDEGSRFSFLLPLSLCQQTPMSDETGNHSTSDHSSAVSSRASFNPNTRPATSEIDNLVEALSTSHLVGPVPAEPGSQGITPDESSDGVFPVTGSQYPIHSVKVDPYNEPALRKATAEATKNLCTPPVVGRGHKPNKLGFFSSTSPSTSPSHGPTSPFLHRNDTTSNKLRVLIVEDNDINRFILGKRLNMSGHTVVNTTNGQEAVEMVESDKDFDLVFMDIQMPILDGFGATQRIREIEQQFEAKWGSTSPRLSKRLNGRIPIFAVSASLRESQRDELMRYGLDGWILKPVDFKRLNVVMQGVLDPARRRHDMYQAGCSWESGGWLSSKMPDDPDDAPPITTPSSSATVT